MLRTRTRTESHSRPTSVRGTVGSARVWDESTRAARRSRAGPGELAATSAPLQPDPRLAAQIGQAVQSALRERMPGSSTEERSTLALELQARILAWLSLEGVPLALASPAGSAGMEVASAPSALEPGQPPAGAPQTVTADGALAVLLRQRLLSCGELVASRPDLLERLIALALQAKSGPAPLEAPASPEELERLDLLRRRLSKLEHSLQEARSALVYVSGLETVETGIASIYRAVQGLASEDPMREQKHQALELLFRANLELQKPAR